MKLTYSNLNPNFLSFHKRGKGSTVDLSVSWKLRNVHIVLQLFDFLENYTTCKKMYWTYMCFTPL
jgi:hypothetical protein